MNDRYSQLREEQGWDEASELSLAQDFIESKSLEDAFVAFLEENAVILSEEEELDELIDEVNAIFNSDRTWYEKSRMILGSPRYTQIYIRTNQHFLPPAQTRSGFMKPVPYQEDVTKYINYLNEYWEQEKP